MSSNIALFDVKKGFLIDGSVGIIYGPGSPSGSELDRYGIGSQWISALDGSVFKKISMVSGPGAWERDTNDTTPTKNIRSDNIEVEGVLDQEYVGNQSTIQWQILLENSDDPIDRRISTISAIHNGSTESEATILNFEEHSILYSKDISESSLVTASIVAELAGSIPIQAIQLVIYTPTGVKINAIVTRLPITVDNNAISVTFTTATETLFGATRLASDSDIKSGNSVAVVTASKLQTQLNHILTLQHSSVILVVDPQIKIYDCIHNPLFVLVYLNRLKLRPTEYILSGGTKIYLNINLEPNDELEIVTIPSYDDSTPGG